jgi:hypothetical protein
MDISTGFPYSLDSLSLYSECHYLVHGETILYSDKLRNKHCYATLKATICQRQTFSCTTGNSNAVRLNLYSAVCICSGQSTFS